MVKPKIYKGIEYVQVSELPEAQRTILLETLNEDLFIKILANGVLYDDCIQYRDYRYWYENIYAPVQHEPDHFKANQSHIPVSGTTSKTFPSGSSK